MSFTYGFFNSKNGDRKYDARQISTMFDGIIEDGVFAHIGNKLAVLENPGQMNTFKLDTGKAWFNSTWILNDTISTLSLGEPELLLYRYDAVCILVSPFQDRSAKIEVIQGTPSSTSPPVKPIIPATYEHVLAYILRRPDSYTPSQADIQNVVGTSECPYITSVLTSVSIDTMIAQWQAQWTTYTGTQQQQFEQWFAAMKAQLSTDAAGHLQLQVNELNDAMAGKEISTFGNLTGTMKWAGGVVAPNGKTYAIPYNSVSVCELDTHLDIEITANYVSTFGNIAGSAKWAGGVLAPNGKIYCAPYDATTIGVIDPVARTLTTIGTIAAGSGKYIGGVLAPNGKIYFIPHNATAVLVLDPVTETTTTFGALGAGLKWAGGVLAPNGKIYCAPATAATVLVIDPATNTTTTIAVTAGNNKYLGATLATNGHIICTPYDATVVLDIDPVTGTTSTFGAGIMTVGSAKYMAGTLAPNGKIYCAPVTAAKVLEIDPITKVVAEIGQSLGTTADKWASSVYVNNCIYGIPRSSLTFLKIKDVKTVGARLKTLETEVGEVQSLKVINRSSVVAGTNEVIDSNRSGWSLLEEYDVFQYYSAAAPNFEVRTIDVLLGSYRDLSNYLSVGMKIRLKQGGAFKYFFIVAIGGDRITLYGGTDYVLTNAAIDYNSIYFSVVQSPHGFPIASTGLGVDFVIERGSNDYGRYTKWASGKMTCEGSTAILMPANTQYVVATIIIPKPFIDANYMWTGSQGSPHGISQLGLATFGQAGVKNYSGFTTHVKTDGIYPSNQYIVLHYIANGNWK